MKLRINCTIIIKEKITIQNKIRKLFRLKNTKLENNLG